MAMSNDDEWLRTARRVLTGQPGTLGLLARGAAVDTTAVSRRLAQAMGQLTGRSIGLFPHRSLWRQTAGVAEVVASEAGNVVVLSPPAERDPVAAIEALGTAIAHARRSFAHLLVDLAGLPLRHPGTLACVDAVAVIARPGGMRDDQLALVEQLLPPERHLGVLLVD
jgi:hypothetical protein